MQITKIQRQQAEEQATEAQLRLYAEPEAGEQLWNIATKYNLTERADYYNFSQLVGDVILGFYKQSEISELLSGRFQQKSPEQLIALEADIKMFLLPLSASTNTQKHHETSKEISTAEIHSIERDINSLKTVHTMSDDVAAIKSEETVHQSSQDAILGTNATTITTPTSDETPRWEST
jgi:hypothetical protein